MNVIDPTKPVDFTSCLLIGIVYTEISGLHTFIAITCITIQALWACGQISFVSMLAHVYKTVLAPTTGATLIVAQTVLAPTTGATLIVGANTVPGECVSMNAELICPQVRRTWLYVIRSCI